MDFRPYKSTQFVGSLLLMLLACSPSLASSNCQISTAIDTNVKSQNLTIDGTLSLTLPSDTEQLNIHCVSDEPSVLTLQRNNLLLDRQDNMADGFALTSHHRAYLLPIGVYQAKVRLLSDLESPPHFELQALDDYVKTMEQHNLIMGVFYGLCFTLALYALIIGRELGDIRFRFCSLYIACAGTFFLLEQGHLNLMFAHWDWVNSDLLHRVFASLTLFTAVLFIVRLLDLHLRFPWVVRHLLMPPAGVVLCLPLVLLWPGASISWFVLEILIPCLSLYLVMAVLVTVGYASYIKVHSAKLVFIAVLVVLVAMVSRLLLDDVSPFVQRYALIISFSFEFLLFAIATSERIKRMNQSRITAEKEAARDVLCDLYNRRGWSAKAQTMLECQRATGGFLCLLYLDIDNFKQINDGYGHQTGDEILLALTKILHNQVRDKDVLGRIGGDEFVVLGHFFQKKQCDSMIYRIRGKLAKLKIRTSVGDVMTSASVGAVIFLEPEQSISHMLYQGDSAMYQQKQRRPSRASEASG